MLYASVKTVVGVLMTANFGVPLVTVVSHQDLWDEPMALLAGNMSLTSTIFGIFIALIGIYDLASSQSVALCRFLQYSSLGSGIAFKMAQVCAAIDQFVAVMFPLRHHSIIMGALPWLFGATWLTCASQVIFGFVAHILDMETFSEHVASYGGNSSFTGCRWETALANIYTIVVELEMMTFSFVTASLLICTGVVGYRIKTQLLREERQLNQDGNNSSDYSQTFFGNYRAFKYIMMVLSLTTVMDIIAPMFRISSRWYPRPKLNGLLHQLRLFGFILEGWAYGLLNRKLRAAYRRMFCRRSRRVVDSAVVQNPQPRIRPKPSAASCQEDLDLRSVESAEAEGRF